MGGRASTGSRNSADTNVSTVDKAWEINETKRESSIKPLSPTKRALEVFDREYRKLRYLAKDLIARGELNAIGYTTLYEDDYEAVFSKRMLQGIQNQINTEWKRIETDRKLGLEDENDLYKRYALNMLQAMLNKEYSL